MIKVFTVGVFDYFHYGHLKLFERCKSYGDYLVIAVQDGNSILKTKPNAKIMYTTEQRVEMVNSIKFVDNVIVYDDVDKIIEKVDFDIFIIGEDQNHAGFQRAVEWCNLNNKKVIRLTRTPNICSSEIKRNLNYEK